MKKIYCALGILLVITGFCWFTAWRVDDLCSTSAQLLEAAETQVLLGDYPAAEETVNHAFRLWQKHECFFGMALRHTESDDVGILFPVLQEACRQKDQGGISAASPGIERYASAAGANGAAVFV